MVCTKTILEIKLFGYELPYCGLNEHKFKKHYAAKQSDLFLQEKKNLFVQVCRSSLCCTGELSKGSEIIDCSCSKWPIKQKQFIILNPPRTENILSKTFFCFSNHAVSCPAQNGSRRHLSSPPPAQDLACSTKCQQSITSVSALFSLNCETFRNSSTLWLFLLAVLSPTTHVWEELSPTLVRGCLGGCFAQWQKSCQD